ncbi:MAG: YcgL domain-containing protein [Pseudomonadales bacterium]|nr:YcgL domain-containing protein [Pseudomonadales bacterium]
MTLICSIYRSPKKEGMYLYVDKKAGITKVPESLLKAFGEPHLVMSLALTPKQKLARVDREEVIRTVNEKGFFLQMPPGKEDYLLNLYTPGSS